VDKDKTSKQGMDIRK